jgi:hypothetical protein
MKFTLSFVALVSTALFAAVHAAPVPLCNGELCSQVAAREVIDVNFDDLVTRAPAKPSSKKSSGSQKGNISQGILNVQKKQGQKPQTQHKKTAANNKLIQKKSADINSKVQIFRKKAEGKLEKTQINKKSDKLRNAEKSRVISQNRKDTKAARTAQWNSKKNSPAQKTTNKAAQTARRADRKAKGLPSPANQVSTKTKISKQQKHNVRQRFVAAKEKLKKMEKTGTVPGRKDTLSVGPHTTDGRAVRQSAFNNLLHSKTPVGRNPINKQPKMFNNRPYAKGHKDATLANKKAIPQNGKEYPIINNSPNGWTGQGGVGALRTVIYKQGGQRKLAVVGHDPKRGGDANDHYT